MGKSPNVLAKHMQKYNHSKESDLHVAVNWVL